ncbi:ABC transporter ATP-binding protein [Actinomadura nitritigenes]|uniref:ABC transporter ATP-binding protein n=1 Tax=Actinomadura nitritigenes TaxID=134602 RepID=A0ABS3R7C7_9ACTN|nr:ABC transporter ATP-binding protein [Actinomadura nitritigenes]MBO2442040.1 ABC transporter ATP-binding protein [Actinomadura nitritigenes]
MTATATRTGLTLSGVTLRYGSGDTLVTALDGVDLTVGPGEVVAVAGPSGSGKSSLLAVAGALIAPTEGTVAIGGTDVTAATPAQRTALRRTGIGYVFQASNLLPSLTARDQLLLVAHLAGRVTREDRDRAAELLDAVGMTTKASRRPHELSGGERQRVGIARALMNRPALLLADEPTAALDQHRARDIVALLAEQAHRRGTATVLVTHDEGLLGTADRVVRIRDGRMN